MGNIIRKYLLLTFVSLFIFSSGAFAYPVSLQMAEDVARTHLRANNERERLAALKDRKVFDKRSISAPEIIELQDEQTGETLAYILGLTPEGFIVVSPDTDITPVIAYSFEGNFPLEDFQDNVLLHMVTWDMENRLEAIPVVPDELKEENNELWESYLSAEDSFLGTLVRATQYGPYLKTTWDQGDPVYGGYNYYCPCDPNAPYILGLCQLSLVGCVATAMAQIVNFHQYPSSVIFTSADDYESVYNPGDGYGTREIDISASGANMPSITYPAAIDTARMLSYACGVSVKMDYSCKGSSAITYDVATALKNKFGYASATALAPVSGYNVPVDPNFYSRLQKNIKNIQPAQLSIYTGPATGTPDGHSIVCDGYDSTSGKYHLNYGWGNSDPAVTWWYSLPGGWYSIRPSGRLDYNLVKYAVLDIKPTEPTGQTLYVDLYASCNGNTPCYTTIQTAIDAASSGSVIKIMAGTYAENLDFNSSNNYELQGGWNSAYSSQTSTSSVGSMTLGSSSGTVTVGYMVVQ